MPAEQSGSGDIHVTVTAIDGEHFIVYAAHIAVAIIAGLHGATNAINDSLYATEEWARRENRHIETVRVSEFGQWALIGDSKPEFILKAERLSDPESEHTTTPLDAPYAVDDNNPWPETTPQDEPPS
jgi:hypothetical protein